MRIIAGRFRGKHLTPPSDEAIRPTSDRTREAVFSMLVSRLGPDWSALRVIDLFAGTGALGLEALSRGAAHVTFVETSAEGRGLIRDHIEAFGAGGVTKLLRRDATALGDAGTMAGIGLAFLDPPYGHGFGERALAGLLAGNWLAPNALVVLEEGADVTVTVPESLVLLDRRTHGAAAIHLLEKEK